MKSHEIPTRPRSKISADLFQLDGSNYLVMVDHYRDFFELYPDHYSDFFELYPDHYSDFFELDPLSENTSANTVIRALKRQFARHGITDECITDKDMNIHVLLEFMVSSYANHHHTTAEGTERRSSQSKLQRTF